MNNGVDVKKIVSIFLPDSAGEPSQHAIKVRSSLKLRDVLKVDASHDALQKLFTAAQAWKGNVEGDADTPDDA